MITELKIEANRKAVKYGERELLLRVIWAVLTPFFRFSPRPFFGWRRFLLRLLGARIGEKTNIYSSAIVYMPWNLTIGEQSAIGEWALIYNLGKVTIGSQTTVSQRVHICSGTHDYEDPALPLIKPEVVIRDRAWICADAFLGPGVIVGEGAVIGARAVVCKDVEPWSVVAGNPAMTIKKRIMKKHAV